MTRVHLVIRSLRQHSLSTCVTAFSIALAVGLMISVWVVKDQSRETFTRVNAGFDAVLGARGSKLQLVLNAIFHLESSAGNLAWTDYEEIARDPNVELAVPIAVGDNYRGYRLVGTQLEFFTKNEFLPGRKYIPHSGRFFDSARREAVVGSFAADQLGLKVGDSFHPYHGLIFNEKEQHSETYIVVGVLKPSNTPADRVIWIPLAGLQRMSGHDPNAARDVSAVLIKFKPGSTRAGFMLDVTYNRRGNRLTLAWPIGGTMAQLLDKIGWFDRVLALVAYLVALVAGASILASIYNSMNERRRDIAILRALGAHRGTISTIIILEAMAIATLGVILSFGLYAIILSFAAQIIRAQTGVVIDPWAWHPVMLWAPLGMIALSGLAGLIPAVKAYRTDVANNLIPVS